MKHKILRKNGHETINLNRRKAIREKCLNCSVWLIKDVENCTHTDCPLYPFRMGTGKQNPKKRDQALKKYCRENCMLGQRYEVSKCTGEDCALYPFRKYG